MTDNQTKVLLHIGYPKTATTTLQEGVFLKLHNLGYINYLGRTVTSTHTPSGRSAFNGVDWVVQLRKHLILNQQVSSVRPFLAENKLNLISDEDLTVHSLFHKAKLGVETNPLLFPEIVSKLISGDTEVSLLLTIRNQPELIYSCFVQKYNYIHTHLGGLSFDDFLNNGAGKIDKVSLQLFDFNILVDSYQSCFPGRVKIVLFEDFVQDRNTFWSQLAELLPVDSTGLDELAGQTHRRKRQRVDQDALIPVYGPSVLGKFLRKLTGRGKYEYWLARRHHLRNSRRLQLEKMILLKKHQVVVPPISDVQQHAIRELFSESNQRFADRMGLDKDRMKKYGYW